MKKALLLFTLLSAGVLKGFCQLPSSCIPTDAVRKLYMNDAKDMALKRMYDLRVADTALIEIPQRYTDTILGVIAAVHNLGKQLEADSIFLNYCIHQWPAHPLTNSAVIEVKIDPNQAWTEAWKKGNTVTGYEALDRFMSLHNVSVKSYFDFRQLVKLTTPTPINFDAFGDSLAKFPGVLYSFGRYGVGDGDHILSWADTAAHIVFMAGWGDCPAGCTSWKHWHYTVNLADCSVKLDTIIIWHPDWSQRFLKNCNLVPARIAQPKSAAGDIFPNPASDFLFFSSNFQRAPQYVIKDMSGRAVMAGKALDRKILIKDLRTGLYIITFFDDSAGVPISRRFLKG